MLIFLIPLFLSLVVEAVRVRTEVGMGRGRVELKRIENKINRQVTFSKRKSGLLKKAREISVLCDADVALFVFSTKGKLTEYSTQPHCLERILQRYESHSYAERQNAANDQAPIGNWVIEHERLKTKIELLQRNQRNLMGEELESLNLRGLQNLEQQLDSGLKHIRSRKNQAMNESILELQKMDKALQERNNFLTKKVKEKENALSQQKQEGLKNNMDVTSVLVAQPMDFLNIGGTPQASCSEGTPTPTRLNTIVPPWMPRPTNE